MRPSSRGLSTSRSWQLTSLIGCNLQHGHILCLTYEICQCSDPEVTVTEPDSSFTRLLTTVSESLASAFRPFLDPLARQARQDRELREFLGSEHFVV